MRGDVCEAGRVTGLVWRTKLDGRVRLRAGVWDAYEGTLAIDTGIGRVVIESGLDDVPNRRADIQTLTFRRRGLGRPRYPTMMS